MGSTILILVMIVLYTMQSFFCKKYTDAYPGKEDMASPVFTIVSGITVVLISLCFMGFSFQAEATTLILGVLNALALMGYNYFIVKTAQTGPYTILMVFSIAGGILLPSIADLIGFGVGISVGKIVALLVVFAAVYMISHRKEETVKWKKAFIPCCIGLGACNGAYSAILNIQQKLTGTSEKEELIAVTYGVAAALSFVAFLLKERGKLQAFKQTKQSLAYLLVCSVVVGLAINVLVCIIPLVNITVLYTFDNAGVFLLSVLCSCVFFKEKLTKLNVAGCAVMCGALVAVAIL